MLLLLLHDEFLATYSLQKTCPEDEDVTRSEAEDAKKALTGAETVEVCSQKSPKKLSRAQFEEAAAELFDRAIAPVKRVLEDQMMKPTDIDHVVLVGGASRMPRIRTMLIDFFGKEKLNMDLDPDLTIAMGAANIDQ